MRIPVLTLAGALALSACSSTGSSKLAVCDGKQLRPANAYGSVLAPAPEGGSAPVPAAADKAKPKTLSAIQSPTSFGSCRA